MALSIHEFTPGTSHVLTGGMKGFKTATLLSTYTQLKYANKKVQLLKPECDYRPKLHEKFGYPRNYMVSRTGFGVPAVEFDDKNPEDLLYKIKQDTEIAVIGEATLVDQPNELIEIVLHLLGDGKSLLVDGLDKNFRGEPYHPMPTLMAYATSVTKLYGICDIEECSQRGEYPQKFIDGKPANYNTDIKEVGDNYEIRCLKHHEVPGKPESLVSLLK